MGFIHKYQESPLDITLAVFIFSADYNFDPENAPDEDRVMAG
jgi:hypothetical protein